MHNIRSIFLACLLLMSASSSVFAEAGIFQFASGEVRLVNSAGAERAANKGDHLNEGDTILTGNSGSAQIRMADGGFISVRANTRMKVDSYNYTGKQDGSEKSFFSLMAGGFRALTGLIGKLNKDNYKITTPSATIGIRGTDHEPMVILPGQKALGEPGTYDKVNSGASFIATAKGVINIAPNQAGFAPGANVAPVILPKMPAFYKESPPVPVEEMQKLQKLQNVDITSDGKDRNDARKDDQGSEAGEKKRGVIQTLGSENGDDRQKDGKKTATGEKRKVVQPGETQAAGSERATGAKVHPPPATGLPLEGGTKDAARTPTVLQVAPALTDKAPATTPLLAPLPGISTTIKLAPLGTTTTQPLASPITTTTTKSTDALAAPDSTTTTTTKTLDPALTTTIQTVVSPPTLTTTTTTVKTLDPALTTTIQPVLTSPTTTTTTIRTLSPTTTTTTIQPILTSPTTTSSPLLTAPLPSPTTTTIKVLP